jgi:hypothetical protein
VKLVTLPAADRTERAACSALHALECLNESLDLAEAEDHTRVPGLLAVAAAMNAAGQQAAFTSTFTVDSAQQWWNDPYAFDQAVRAANRIFEAMRPAGKIAPPPGMSGMAGTLDMGKVAENFGVGYANGILSEIANERPISTTAVTRAPKLRRDLGEELVRRIQSSRGDGL